MSQFFKRVQRFAKKSPIAAGIPFMGMIVAASYGFSYITQVKYDYIDAKYTTSEKREKLGLKNAEPIDIRKIYFVSIV
ncbi:Cytochrome oxidase assembly, variant 2 [Batrachochytrium dendrobatidis]|nr:Cytochrome oxidase assembly, variant 2 [Batrachochytrium dendrobatidis]